MALALSWRTKQEETGKAAAAQKGQFKTFLYYDVFAAGYSWQNVFNQLSLRNKTRLLGSHLRTTIFWLQLKNSFSVYVANAKNGSIFGEQTRTETVLRWWKRHFNFGNLKWVTCCTALSESKHNVFQGCTSTHSALLPLIFILFDKQWSSDDAAQSEMMQPGRRRGGEPSVFVQAWGAFGWISRAADGRAAVCLLIYAFLVLVCWFVLLLSDMSLTYNLSSTAFSYFMFWPWHSSTWRQPFTSGALYCNLQVTKGSA